ncbi:MAG: CpaF family protein [Proteobacteria bacterium]|nr:CpaF family protein [Pseudomonadota bacterium]
MSTATIHDALKSRLAEKMNAQERGFVEPHQVQNLAGEVFEELEQGGVDLTGVDRYTLANQVALEFLRMGPILAPMLDPDVSEVMINGPDTIFIEKNGQRFKYASAFKDARDLRTMISRLVETVPGKRIDEAAPMVDLSLPDGSRVNIAIPPVVVGGPQVTIRKYIRSLVKLEDIQARETLDQRMGQFLRACVASHVNMLFSGASGSGKTTLMEILAHGIPDRERLVVIEDTLELKFQQPNVVRMLTRAPNVEGFGEITTSQCFHNSLRMRPSRIIIGELRGPEALDYLQALNSGHRGSLAVIHASSADEAVIRVENLSMLGARHVPAAVVQQQLVHGLDVIVQLEQLADGSRKVVAISQLSGLKPDGGFIVEDIFRFEPSGVDDDGKVQGRFVATGVVPYFLQRIQLEGITLSDRAFSVG